MYVYVYYIYFFKFLYDHVGLAATLCARSSNLAGPMQTPPVNPTPSPQPPIPPPKLETCLPP